MTHEIDLEKITFFFCLQSTMSLNVSAMSWVMCDDDDDDEALIQNKALQKNPEKLIIEKKPTTTVIYKRTTLSAKATSSL